MIILNSISLSSQGLQNAMYSFDSHASQLTKSLDDSMSVKSTDDFIDHMVGMNLSVKQVQMETKKIKANDEMFGYLLDIFA